MNFKVAGIRLYIALFWSLVLLPTELLGVSVDVIAIDSFVSKPRTLKQAFPYVINLNSYSKPLEKTALKHLGKLPGRLLYYTKVRVDGVIYYRLSLGNYASRRQAQISLGNVKVYYPNAWIGKRTGTEQALLLKAAKQVAKSAVVVPKVDVSKEKMVRPVTKTKPRVKQETSLPKKLLKQAKEEFLKQNYTRVISISDKLMEIGDNIERQKALELTGLARERQRQFAQAIAIYEQFMDLYPDSEFKPRIEQRLRGLKTMDLDPQQLISNQTKADQVADWNLHGGLAQYYRNNILDRGDIENESVNEAFVTDLDLYARRKTASTSLVIQFDGGFIKEQITDESDSRISRALVSFTDSDSDYRVTAGRQTRTAKGIYGRFDGFVYQGLSHDDFNYSLYTGYVVESTFESANSDRQFVGASISLIPFESVDMDVYVVQQDVFDLTDRQAIGTEFQVRGERGFLYGIVDYDTFYSNLNSATAITNYRYDDQWTLNLTYDYRNTPFLSTTNAIIGQGVESIDELQKLFSDSEIYQLAEDRTSASQNVIAGASYQIDADRQLYMNLSYTSIESAEASAGVPEFPATDDVHISGEYSIRGYFYDDDYSSFGLGIADTSSAEAISLRARTRFPGPAGFRYDPRIWLDFRKSKNSDLEQWILAPSIRLTYQYGRNTSFEGSFGIEYSNFDLPELDDQTVYDFFLGYVYQF